MGRFSRVKGGHGSGKKSEVPDLEAHFSDGAWYDIVLRTADPSKNRFLVQVRSDHQPRLRARARASPNHPHTGSRGAAAPAVTNHLPSSQQPAVRTFATYLKCSAFSVHPCLPGTRLSGRGGVGRGRQDSPAITTL